MGFHRIGQDWIDLATHKLRSTWNLGCYRPWSLSFNSAITPSQEFSPQVSISTYLDGQNNPTSTPPPSTHTLVSLPPAPFTLHASWDKWASWTWNLPSHPDEVPDPAPPQLQLCPLPHQLHRCQSHQMETPVGYLEFSSSQFVSLQTTTCPFKYSPRVLSIEGPSEDSTATWGPLGSVPFSPPRASGLGQGHPWW